MPISFRSRPTRGVRANFQFKSPLRSPVRFTARGQIQTDWKQLFGRTQKFGHKWLISQAKYVRVVMRRLLNKRATRSGVASPPGQPPLRRTGFLRGGIVYALDRKNNVAYIGALPAKSRHAHLLEYGGYGRAVIPRKRRGNWIIGGSERQNRYFRYRARPFARPALPIGLREHNNKALTGKL